MTPSYGGPVWLLHEPVAFAPTDGLPMPANLGIYLDISLADRQYVNRYVLYQMLLSALCKRCPRR